MKSPTVLYEIEGLSFSIKDRELLAAAAVTIAEGGIHCLVGPNGAGKSLTLALLAGLLRPGKGAIRYRGRPLQAVSTHGDGCREITLVHQHPFLFSGSVLANVTYGMRGGGLVRREKERRAAELLERVGLPGFGSRNARKISAGETSRVALARALACGARTLILDEPTASIDRDGIALVEEIISAQAQKEGRTVIMSTHGMGQARRLARSTLFVRDGRLYRSAPGNVLRGRVVSRNGGRYFDSGRIVFQVPDSESAGRCSVGIAEESITIRPGGEAAGDNSLTGRVISLAGGNGAVSVAVDVGERFILTVKEEEIAARGLTVGSRVALGIPPESVRFIR